MRQVSGDDGSEPARGDAIGRFVVLGLLGSGGMGLVYSAYDPHLDRKVAIKLLRHNASDADAELRLLREAQAMAKIDHPNVVRVHEAGMHGKRVYLAMEFVGGGTLRAWLRMQPRTVREILAVFVHAGRGLAAAHAAGLVHRDFKPDNVLIANDGTARVTDFGIVGVWRGDREEVIDPPEPHVPRRDSQPLSQDLTRPGSIMGTPSYMAAEQFNGQVLTSRTDQFAFCVALYVALYKQRPFRGTSLEEIRISVTQNKLEPAPRSADVPSWLRRIVVRGLSHDPEARFSSMTDLLAAIERNLTRGQRRATWIGAAAIVALGGGAFAWHARNDARSCDGDHELARVWNPRVRDEIQASFLASHLPIAATWFVDVSGRLDAWGERWKAGYADACRDHEHAPHVVDLRAQCVGSRLDAAAATIGLLAAGGRDAVEHAVDSVVHLPGVAPCADTVGLLSGTAPPDDAIERGQVRLVEVQLENVKALARLGRYPAARALAGHALDAARATGYAPVIAAATLRKASLGELLDPKHAADDLRAALVAALAAGTESIATDASRQIVDALALDGHHDDALRDLRDIMNAIATHAHGDPELAVDVQISDSAAADTLGNLAEAQAGYEKAVALAKKLPVGDTELDTALDRLGSLLKREGKLVDAQHVLERALALREQLYGKDHPAVASALNNLGNVYRAQAKFDDAKRYYDRALAIRIAAFGPIHEEVATSYLNLGVFFSDRGDEATALSYFQKALAIFEQVRGSDSDDVASASLNVGASEIALGRLAEGRAQLERAVAICAASNPNDPRIAGAMSNLAEADLAEGKNEEALAKTRRAEQITIAAYGPDHPDVGDYLTNEASQLVQLNRFDEAWATQLRANAIIEKAYGPKHPHTGFGLAALAHVQHARGELAAAAALATRAVAILEVDQSDAMLSSSLLELGDILVDQHRTGEALPYLQRALALREAANTGPTSLAEVHFALATALYRTASNRARGEAQTALTLFTQGSSPPGIAEAKDWLASHR